MTISRSNEYLYSLLKELLKLPNETEWVEFKHNNDDPKEIGEYISALSNSAPLVGKECAYVIWGVNNENHEIVGTSFKPANTRHKQQELESWLLQKIDPRIDFHFYELTTDQNLLIVILEVQAAHFKPVRFDGTEYIRIGSYTKKLCDFPEKESRLWLTFNKTPFEQQIAAENISAEEVLNLIDYPAYFELTNKNLPEDRTGILFALKADDLIKSTDSGLWNITNFGAILFAKQLKDFSHLSRKAVRVIQYTGINRIETLKEIAGNKGYAVGYNALMDHLKTLFPSREKIGPAFRQEISVYPFVAVRELVVNALIHQDFSLKGTGPTIELFSDRIEITNPGIPLVDTQRFLDIPPKSRNEKLASFMRRIGICEERGSGIDKVVYETEVYQLPAPLFEQTDNHTRVVLFAHKNYRNISIEDRVRACYLHCCLKYVDREFMNNTSLRERFGMDVRNSAMISRLIKQALDAKQIEIYDETVGPKAMRYIPWWARIGRG